MYVTSNNHTPRCSTLTGMDACIFSFCSHVNLDTQKWDDGNLQPGFLGLINTIIWEIIKLFLTLDIVPIGNKKPIGIFIKANTNWSLQRIPTALVFFIHFIWQPLFWSKQVQAFSSCIGWWCIENGGKCCICYLMSLWQSVYDNRFSPIQLSRTFTTPSSYWGSCSCSESSSVLINRPSYSAPSSKGIKGFQNHWYSAAISCLMNIIWWFDIQILFDGVDKSILDLNLSPWDDIQEEDVVKPIGPGNYTPSSINSSVSHLIYR